MRIMRYAIPVGAAKDVSSNSVTIHAQITGVLEVLGWTAAIRTDIGLMNVVVRGIISPSQPDLDC